MNLQKKSVFSRQLTLLKQVFDIKILTPIYGNSDLFNTYNKKDKQNGWINESRDHA